ncbi:TetR/AcrR family transcriptional regulator [Kitasatospora purpeofusca]|uniref:TetR/AcrR family transcriptional regulator n=1 Tax=Kitasatospora purpeofusca TaxID=67352 RepID=UPI00367828E6
MPPITTVDGRRIGRRGLKTRQAILTATAEMLADTGVVDMKVMDLARVAGTSPATFYQYFATRDAVLLELAADLVRQTARAVATATDGATALSACFKVWQSHGPVLRTVEVLAATNADFRKIRGRIRKPLADFLGRAAASDAFPVEQVNAVLAMVSATAADSPTARERTTVLNVALTTIGC